MASPVTGPQTARVRRHPAGTSTRARHASERGGVELAALILLTPALLAAVSVVVYAGRAAEARSALAHSADAAAQAAALERGPAAATARALDTAKASLADAGRTCSGGPTVRVDTTDFRPGGVVRVGIACAVDRSDLFGIDLPGAITLAARASAVIDRYRGAGAP